MQLGKNIVWSPSSSVILMVLTILCAEASADEKITNPDSCSDTKPGELVSAEIALGRDLSSNYQRFLQIPKFKEKSYVEFLYEHYKKKRRTGLILAAVVAPVFATFTAGGVLALIFKANKMQDECDGEEDCFLAGAQYLFIAGFVGIFGTVGTVANLIVGSIFYARGKKRMNLLESFLPKNKKPLAKKPTLNLGVSSLGEAHGVFGASLVLSF